MLTPTIEHSFIAGRDVHSITCPQGMAMDEFEKTLSENIGDLRRYGFGFDARDIETMMEAFAMDSIQQGVTTPSIVTPVQFLQNWLPGFVKVMTAARKIDEIIGISTAGNWDDETIVQGILENTGTSVPYGDYTNVPLSSWNVNFVQRTVVRFEEGMQVGRLEEARAARIRVNSGQMKRESAALALDIQRNLVGFNGFNNGQNQTYGFLNDPALPAYVTVAASGTGSSTLWSSKNFLEITADIRVAVIALRTQSQDTIDPKTTPMTLAISTNCVDFLSVTSDFNVSVQDWINKAYPNIRVVSAPQLNSANGGANVFYLFADSVNDLSTDDGRTFTQVVPAKFQVLGVMQKTKGYEEDYSNATAGAMCKRPYAVVRFTGI